jgi:hypothetical protein
MLTKEISEVEKERNVFIDQIKLVENWSEEEIVCFLRKNFEKFVELETKLSTLKSAQQKFDKFVSNLKEKDFIMSILNDCVTVDEEEGMKFICVDEVRKKIDELSSKQEGKE